MKVKFQESKVQKIMTCPTRPRNPAAPSAVRICFSRSSYTLTEKVTSRHHLAELKTSHIRIDKRRIRNRHKAQLLRIARIKQLAVLCEIVVLRDQAARIVQALGGATRHRRRRSVGDKFPIGGAEGAVLLANRPGRGRADGLGAVDASRGRSALDRGCIGGRYFGG